MFGLQPAKKMMEEGEDKGNIQPGEESLLLVAFHSGINVDTG